MDKHLVIEVGVRPSSAADADDTTGLIMRGDGGSVPQPSGQAFPIPTIQVPVRIPIPVPGPLPPREPMLDQDVQGYLWDVAIVAGAAFLGTVVGGYWSSQYNDTTYYKNGKGAPDV